VQDGHLEIQGDDKMPLTLEELEAKERAGMLLPVEQQQLNQLRVNDEAMFSFMPPARSMAPQGPPGGGMPGQGAVMPRPAATAMPQGPPPGGGQLPGGMGQPPPQPGSEVVGEDGMMRWAALLAPFMGMLGGAALGGKKGAAMGLLGGSKYTEGYDVERERQQQIARQRGVDDLARRETESQIGLRGAQAAKATAEAGQITGVDTASEALDIQIAEAARLQQWERAADLAKEKGDEALARTYRLEAQEARVDRVRAFQDRGLWQEALEEAGEGDDADFMEDVARQNAELKLKASHERAKSATDLRKEFSKESKLFEQSRDSMGRVFASAEDPTPAGDLALIFNYMKLLDPGSVVRESEFQTAAASDALLNRAKVFLKKITVGRKMSDDQIVDFVDRAKRLYKVQTNIQKQRVGIFNDLATRRGLDPMDVTIDISLPGFEFDEETAEATPAERRQWKARIAELEAKREKK